jgi:peptidoglycan/LPS O-acetylase OafA/YrhL
VQVSCLARVLSQTLRACGWCTHFRVLLRRAVRAQLRNPTDATSRLLMSTCVGLLAGARPRPRAPAPARARSCCAPSATHAVMTQLHAPRLNQSIARELRLEKAASLCLWLGAVLPLRSHLAPTARRQDTKIVQALGRISYGGQP